jgi:hypothetical protein
MDIEEVKIQSKGKTIAISKYIIMIITNYSTKNEGTMGIEWNVIKEVTKKHIGKMFKLRKYPSLQGKQNIHNSYKIEGLMDFINRVFRGLYCEYMIINRWRNIYSITSNVNPIKIPCDNFKVISNKLSIQ